MAQQFGLMASFMPKPVYGQNGSGMHTHQSLFRGKDNAFWDKDAKWELSQTALHYIGGLLTHARGFCAITTATLCVDDACLPFGSVARNVSV